VNRRELRAAAQAAFGETMVEKKALLEAAKATVRPARDVFAMAGEIAEFGLTAEHVVIDVGSGRGDWSRRIVERYGCACVAIDVAPSRLGECRRKGLPALMAEGDELPLAAGTIDAVWCRDMLEMVFDPATVLEEFARVLRPGGGTMLYVPVATETLEPLEKSHVMTLDMPDWWAHGRAPVDDAIHDAGFEVLRCEVMSPEYTQGMLERDPTPVIAQMIEHAQLRRGRAEVEAALGADWYARFDAWTRWQMYLLLGKIENTLWLLRKPFGQRPSL
jgi:ubiquinone/menaquinone biosynthesis C-methylase UbiE